MTTKAGVWIDHKQAVVVLITDAGQETKNIPFDIGQPVRSASKSSSKKKYTPNDFVSEDRLGRKVEDDRKDYFNDVLACIKDANALLILGPGEAKGELSKHIKSKKLRGIVIKMEAADKMTDRQIAAKAQQHFAASRTKKLAAPRMPTKQVVKTSAGKRPKKT